MAYQNEIASLAAHFADPGVLAAEFTDGSKRVRPKLTITRIRAGRRTLIDVVNVSSKREARAIATARGATCWNF